MPADLHPRLMRDISTLLVPELWLGAAAVRRVRGVDCRVRVKETQISMGVRARIGVFPQLGCRMKGCGSRFTGGRQRKVEVPARSRPQHTK